MVAFNNEEDRLRTLLTAKTEKLNVKVEVALSSDEGDAVSVLKHVNGVLNHLSESKSVALPKIPNTYRNPNK